MSIIAERVPTTIRAVIFDLDGTLVDTEQVVFEAWRNAFCAHGSNMTLAEWGPNVGTDRGFDPLELLATRAGRLPAGREQTKASVSAEIEKRLSEMGPRPGVRSWIAEALALGLKVAVASSSPIDWVELRLAQLDLSPHIDVVSCRSERLRAKPDPDVYLDACHRLEVLPRDALAVEDSSSGIAAAVSAGMHCLVVPNEVTRDLDLTAATLQLVSLEERGLGEVIRQLV